MVMLPGQKDRMRAREYHWRAGLYIYMLILLWTSTRTLLAYGCLVLHQSIVGVELQATHTILGFMNHKAKYDTVHTIDYDSHVQYFAGRVHLRSLVFLSARAELAQNVAKQANLEGWVSGRGARGGGLLVHVLARICVRSYISCKGTVYA